MIFLGGFFGRISSDFRQKELLPLKLLFFVHSSTLYVLYPYLTIHMRELGISVEETAIMSAVTPLVAIIMPPLAGLIADKIGNFKVLLSLFSGFGGAASLLLLLVPVGRMVITYPERTVVEIACSQERYAELSLVEPYPCERKGNRSSELKVQIEACGMICHKPQFVPYAEVLGPRNAEEEAISILRTRNYTVLIGSNSYEYTLSGDDVETSSKAKNTAHTRVLKTTGRFPTAVRNLSSTKYFFPTSGLFQFTCTSESCGLVQAQGVPQKILHSPKILETSVIQGRSTQNKMHSFLLETIRDSNSTKYLNYTCQEGGDGSVGRVMVPLLNPENSLEVAALLEFANCSTTCLATLPRTNICSNLKVTTELNISLTFWLYLTIRVFIGMIGGTAFAMFEGAVIAILREHKADYGLQRIYATIGGMISSPLSGWLIDYASRGKDFTDYRPTFYLYAVLKIVSALLMLTINLEFKAPATNVLSDVLFVLRKAEVVALFITCFILGTAWGYIESFLFWFLEDLGASRSLMGITITVGGIAGLPLLVMSGPIIDRIGHANVLFIGFIFYAIRLVGYSLIYNPWMCLIFEAMESMTSSLAFTAAVTYAAKLSTTTTDSSIQGLLGGLYFGVGKGSGSLIGGYLMKAVGTRPTYQIFAAVTLITGCLYYLFNKFYIVARSNQKQDSGEKDPSNEKGVTLEEPKKQKQNGTEPKVLPPSQKSGEEQNCVVRSLSDHSKVNAGFEPDVKEKR